ncbi:DUF349 domain-containing protein [Zobellia sp. B3R18]|uniref:DUF349 domain-containing protein n=1 Tax=Zobellia sp. B3R18 TaxID=2841568 RepID=UPI001C073BE2|nr:DUF349 domain-containing protein [Zobellia sp. B3R18]MBU2975820.1 DUF349 domain-containing protein [Zobellia sp. B3R18]
MEDKERELQHNVGEENKEEITKTTEPTANTEASEVVDIPEKEPSGSPEEKDAPTEPATTEAAETEKTEAAPSKSTDEEEVATTAETNDTASKDDDAVLEEIDENNAEDAEDTDNQERHTIPLLDYHSMSMENLVGELQKLVRNEKVQAIKKHVDGIKSEFDLKFQEFIEGKKEDFINGGGNEIDFRYNSVTKRQFNEVYSDYREKRNQYYKSLEKNLKENLNKRLEIIEELKSLVNVDEDMNTTYKAFKELQENWRNAGPIPRTEYNNVWRTYQHHIEIFYDFLHLNRELRDLDFKHNLEEKEKLVAQAELLAKEPDLTIAFRDLQTLHKIWKEDIGPVGQEHREEIWERFSNATKVLHQRRQDHYKELDAQYEKNLVAKNEIIASIQAMSANVATSHKALQQQIKKLEELRNAFFAAGKVPRNQNEKTWDAFKTAVRNFNRSKNAYYKNLKKEQQENLDKKRALLDRAVALKDSEEWDSTTPEMKRIQNDWKQIGHVPRKYSDKIWKEFKTACNHYFDRLHALKNEGLKEEQENFEKKNACLERLSAFELSGKREDDLKTIKEFIAEWKSYGRVPFKKKNIDQKFNKILDGIFKKLDIDRQESELLKYGNKIQQLADADNERAIQNERSFIRKKIEESKAEIRQLETNLQFFSNASEDNPLVRDVVKRVEAHKETLETWKAKLKKLNILKHDLNKANEEEEAASGEEE